jgi:hypothetical protein
MSRKYSCLRSDPEANIIGSMFYFTAIQSLTQRTHYRIQKFRIQPQTSQTPQTKSENIVEIKAVKQLCMEHKAQILNYLAATSLKVGF